MTSLLPALVFNADLLPNSGPLNGRRWASQLLFRLWLDHSCSQGIDLLLNDPKYLDQVREALPPRHHAIQMRGLSILDPFSVARNGALFVPDPSIASWSSWRQKSGHASFSLIGQIHTLSTTAVINMIDQLIVDPVYEWDALICSSTAGKRVVENLFNDRTNYLRERLGAKHFPQPQLPVIPLPLGEECFDAESEDFNLARQHLNIPQNDAVVLWLGRRSMLTKADPWPTYRVLDTVAAQLDRPLWLIECGPVDTDFQDNHFAALQKICPNVRFLKLGSKRPVTESTKRKALKAADLVLSLVDNIQETFGLSIAEAMAMGKPIVASNWDGYRDLVRDGTDGFLIPSRWDDLAADVSFALGWMQRLEPSSFPHISGTLSQLVQLDLPAAESAILALLTNPPLARAMGKAARDRALALFSPSVVMKSFLDLFEELSQIRNNASKLYPPTNTPARLDPVRIFKAYSSHADLFKPLNPNSGLPEVLIQARLPFVEQMKQASPLVPQHEWQNLLNRKHS